MISDLEQRSPSARWIKASSSSSWRYAISRFIRPNLRPSWVSLRFLSIGTRLTHQPQRSRQGLRLGREGLVEVVASGEGLDVGEEVDAGTVAGERHVGGVAVHDGVGEDVA